MITNTCPNPGTPSSAAGLGPAEEAVATAGRNIIPPTATARPMIFSVCTACMACLPQKRDPTTVGPQQHDGQDSPPGQLRRDENARARLPDRPPAAAHPRACGLSADRPPRASGDQPGPASRRPLPPAEH